MIVPMVRVSVLALRRERARVLGRLQDLGVLHLGTEPVHESRVEEERRALNAVRSAEAALRRERPAPGGGATASPDAAFDEGAARARVAEVETCQGRIAQAEEELQRVRAEILRVRPLGAFDPDAVRALARRDLTLWLYSAPAGKRLALPDDAVAQELGVQRGRRYLALVRRGAGSEGAPPVLDGAEPVALPDRSTAQLARRERVLEATLADERARLAGLRASLPALRQLERTEEDRLAFEEARARLGTAGPLVTLTGFCPERDVPRLVSEASAHGWGLVVGTVDDAGDAPTLVEPPRWARSIETLFGLVGVLPGYDQVDVSVPFLLFFSLFFAMIVGDAGYGLLFLLLTFAGRRLLPAAPARAFALLRVLSVTTIVWGLATGTVFGMAALPKALQLVRLSWLTDPDHIILLSFFLGALHLSLAHAWNAVRWWGTLRALAQVGWALVVWGMFFLVRSLVLAAPFPSVVMPVLIVGVALVALFMTPWRRLGQEWFAHAMLPLNLVSAFVDVVSYVRLFAVGAASFAVASAFNEIALGGGVRGVVGGVLAALVLFFGHALNIALASLGVLVHGVRLNTLEFAGHLGIEWTGVPYRPFARRAAPAAPAPIPEARS